MARKPKSRSKRKPQRKAKTPAIAPVPATEPDVVEEQITNGPSEAGPSEVETPLVESEIVEASVAEPEPVPEAAPTPEPVPLAPERESSAAAPPDPAQALRALRRGDVFGGRYHLERIVGKGAMGITWLARETQSGELRALKILVPAFTQDAARLAALGEGVAQAATLEHPHILRVHELVQDAERGLCAVAMEVAAGSIEKLRLERPNQRFEPAEIVDWLRQLCAALEYAHTEKHAVHRDLKPANLLLDADGRLKLADFGIPMLPDERMLHVTSSETSGAPAFMSPEQLRGDGPRPSDDLYALGATLYALLVGKPPFLAATVDYQLYQTLHETVPGIEERRRELSGSDAPVPQEWANTIHALLSRDASARPSLSEVVARLAGPRSAEVSGPLASATREDATKETAEAPTPAIAAAPGEEAAPPKVAPPRHAPVRPSTPTRRIEWSSALILGGIVIAAVTLGWWLSREKPRARSSTAPATASPTAVPRPTAMPPATPSPAGSATPAAPSPAEKPPSPMAAVTLPGVMPSPAPPASAEPTSTAAAFSPPPASRPLPPFTNSLGMRFVGLTGTQIRVCIWPTRLRDFTAFAKAAKLKSTSWQNPGFAQTPDHPVVDVSWNEAAAFCKWLTRVEQDRGELRPDQRYRLLTDLEWSKAVGLGEEKGETPEQRDMGVPEVYPWGKAWPPPVGAGNYSGQETDAETAIKNYDDGFLFTSPVGSFPPNRFGLYDMGGNVWEWVEDNWNRESKDKAARGASWYNGALKLSLLSCCRVHGSPDSVRDNYGFRIVLEDGGRRDPPRTSESPPLIYERKTK